MSGIKGLFLFSMILVAMYLGAQGAPELKGEIPGEWLLASNPVMKYVLISSDRYCHSVQDGATLPMTALGLLFLPIFGSAGMVNLGAPSSPKESTTALPGTPVSGST